MDSIPAIVFIGAGGHARVVFDALRSSGDNRPVAFLDADPTVTGTTIFGARVVGDDEMLPDLARAGASSFVVGVGATSDNRLRHTLFQRALDLGLKPLSVVHRFAIISASAILAPGCQVMAGAVINANSRVGSNTIINTGAIVEHDCVIAESAHVSTGATLGGSVNVGPLAHVGIGATVRQGITIHARAVVGAGAVVVRDVPPESLVFGVPAKER